MGEVNTDLEISVQITVLFKKERPETIELPGVVKNPEMKYCPRCKTDKPLAEFSKNKRDARGVQSYCKICMCKYNEKYETVLKENKEWNFKEENLLREQFYKKSISELDKLFPGHSVKEIKRKAKLMGMKV